MAIIGSVEWGWCSDGTIDLVFKNHLTGASTTRNYKTEGAAKGAETKFYNRLNRIYTDMLASRIEVHIPGLDYDEED